MARLRAALHIYFDPQETGVRDRQIVGHSVSTTYEEDVPLDDQVNALVERFHAVVSYRLNGKKPEEH